MIELDNFLKQLSDLQGVSGNEENIISYIVKYAKQYTNDIKTDCMNNLYICRDGFGDKRKSIMLCAHMDEVGFIVSSITEDGYLKFRIVGGIDTSVLLARRVLIGENQVKGVIGIKAVHLSEKNERNVKVSDEDMYIDIGVDSFEEANNLINIGDYVNFDIQADDFGDLIKGKAFDDRIGCYILCKLMEKQYYDNIIYCFTVQEETGLRGASVAAYNIKADCCYVIESTTCLDFPKVGTEKRVTKIGCGPAITIVDRTTYPDKSIAENFMANCDKIQFKQLASGGNDAGTIHLNGIKTASVSIPSRYIHSPVSVVSYKDIELCIETFDKILTKGVDNFD